MNIPEIEKQVLPYLIKLAESPPVQAEIEAAKAAIISIIESQSLSISKRVIRWIRNKIKRGNVKMATTTITVKNSEGTVLSGATISYTVSGTTVEGTTDTNGQLAIEGLEASTYTFTATLDGYTSASVDVTVDGTNDTTGVVTMATETIESVAEDAATESLSDSLTSESSNLITYLTNLADERIAMWEADSVRTKDNFVKFRNSIYIMDLKAAKAAVKAGGTIAIALLAEKLTK